MKGESRLNEHRVWKIRRMTRQLFHEAQRETERVECRAQSRVALTISRILSRSVKQNGRQPGGNAAHSHSPHIHLFLSFLPSPPPLVTLPPEFRPRSRCSLDENARSEHRSLKRNWILDACTLSNSSLTFLRGEGIYPRIRRVVRFFWFSVLRLHSPFDSFLDHSDRTSFSPDYTLQFFSTPIPSIPILRPLSIPFPFPSSITLASIPISLRLHPLRLPSSPFDYNPPRLHSLRLHPLSLSLSLDPQLRSRWLPYGHGHESKVQNSAELREEGGEFMDRRGSATPVPILALTSEIFLLFMETREIYFFRQASRLKQSR